MEYILGAGLIFGGILLNANNKTTKSKLEIENKNNDIKPFPKNYYDNYKSKIYTDSNEFLYNSISDLYKKSLKPDSRIVNNIYRILNDPVEKNKKMKINNLLNKDINMIKKTYNNNNNIETMKNIETIKNIETMNNMNNMNMLNNYDSDSDFSDNYSIPTKSNKKNKYLNSDSELSDNYTENNTNTNINLKVLNQQDRFLSDIITNLSGSETEYELEKSKNNNINNINNKYCKNTFESQYDELKFNHEGIPETIQNGKQMLNIFNDKIKFSPQSTFDAKSDGRYGVTSNMTHNNMVPFFSSKTYGYNPGYDKERENYSVRQVELFTGSDQNPQFKHKKEVVNLFSPETNKVESVTGVPNFNDYFESRYIPSQTRNGERPFEPIRTTPGLNLGYNEIGNTGRQDLYRVLPKTVDQLRTVNNPKVSYTEPVIPGQKGDRRGIIGNFIQKGPDRFYYNAPDSMLPQIGDHVAPALYGKWLVDQTNRSLNPDNPGLNPLGGIEKSTPEYLQGQFKKSFKREEEQEGPRNVQLDTRGQIINQETWIPNETNRQSVNYTNNYNGNIKGNKEQNYLENFENGIPEVTQRETIPELPNLNINGNYKSVPLINFLNIIPDITRKEILLEDNGRKNITNISNSIKGYLFNSINAIQDPTLRDLISQKIILTNTKGPQEQNYLFNMTNSIQDPNMRNLSEDNLILTTLSNHEKGYLFNNINAIPDPTLRELINTLYSKGGYGMKGNHQTSQLFNYVDGIPDTTLRELTENIIQLTNVTGPVGSIKQYLFDYINAIPDINMRQLTENKEILTNIQPIQVKNYLLNYINSIPDTTLKELTENNKYLTGHKGSQEQNYMFNYDNAIPNSTMRELIEEIRQITNLTGNHKAEYLINYINAIPDKTLKELTENKEILTNMKPIQVKDYLINYINAIPDITLKELYENQKYIIGQKGSHTQDYMFNYENSIKNPTQRNMTENQKYIIGQKGSHIQDYMFNYNNGIPDATARNQTETTTNIIGQKGNKEGMTAFNYEDKPNLTMRDLSSNTKNITGVGSQYTYKEYMFNYQGGIPDDTARNQTETTKNITGQKGDQYQLRSRLDYSNALLNNVKEGIAEGRMPTIVKNNKGPTCMFTEYTFNDDKPLTQRPIYSGIKPIINVENPLYMFN